jgi:hypothetical protein
MMTMKNRNQKEEGGGESDNHILPSNINSLHKENIKNIHIFNLFHT